MCSDTLYFNKKGDQEKRLDNPIENQNSILETHGVTQTKREREVRKLNGPASSIAPVIGYKVENKWIKSVGDEEKEKDRLVKSGKAAVGETTFIKVVK